MIRFAAKLTERSTLNLFNRALFSHRNPKKPSEWWDQKTGVRTKVRIYEQTQKLMKVKSEFQSLKNKKEEASASKPDQEEKDKKADTGASNAPLKGQGNVMKLLIVGAIAFLLLHNTGNDDPTANLGVETNEADFYNRASLGQFKSVRVVRMIGKSKKDQQKREWVTKLVGVTDSTNFVIDVLDLKQTLKRLDRLKLPVEFEHRTQKSALEKKSNFAYIIRITIAGVILLFIAKLRKSGVGGINDITSRMRGKPFKPTGQSIKTQFKDVAGLQEAKKQITEFVEFLKKPDKFTDMGAKIPRGALLTGPPGTGKTLLAKACAGEAGVPFFYISGSEFVQKFVGVGASRVRSLFESAIKTAPSIIFIDEIDAIGKKRGSGPRTNQERDSTLNQLLVNMDGFGTDAKVVVLADMLDPALLRPGRFDRIIQVSLPDLEGRYEILSVHLDKIKFDPSMTKEALAKRLSSLTPGFSGADLSNICNEAAILAARANKESVEMIDFEQATQRVLAGLEKRNNLTEEQKRIIAYHESGRAIASWMLEGGDPLIKLTIIPRSKKSLGYSQFLPDQISLNTKQQLLDKIGCALAGKVSEQLVLNQVTDSSTADLEKARKIASAMVTRYGMSDVVSNIGYPDNELIKKPYSPFLEQKIDDEVFQIINKETVRVRQLLQQNIDKLNKLANALLQKETLNLDQLKEILGERPFAARSNFKAYLSLTKDASVTAD